MSKTIKNKPGKTCVSNKRNFFTYHSNDKMFLDTNNQPPFIFSSCICEDGEDTYTFFHQVNSLESFLDAIEDELSSTTSEQEKFGLLHELWMRSLSVPVESYPGTKPEPTGCTITSLDNVVAGPGISDEQAGYVLFNFLSTCPSVMIWATRTDISSFGIILILKEDRYKVMCCSLDEYFNYFTDITTDKLN